MSTHAADRMCQDGLVDVMLSSVPYTYVPDTYAGSFVLRDVASVEHCTLITLADHPCTGVSIAASIDLLSTL